VTSLLIMPMQNLILSMKYNSEGFATLFFRWRFLIAVVFAIAIIALPGCSKTASPVPSTDLLNQYFEQNILNRDFVVDSARDNGTELTAQYNGYTFRLLKNTYYDGPMNAVKTGSQTITGTWSSNEDYSKLTITLNQPASPAEFAFINRPWRFTSKAFPVMKLAPWGTTDAKVLHMRRL
jgi:hypothetical protein